MFPENLSSRSDLEMSVGLVKSLLVYLLDSKIHLTVIWPIWST